jgi:hypothetical protein
MGCPLSEMERWLVCCRTTWSLECLRALPIFIFDGKLNRGYQKVVVVVVVVAVVVVVVVVVVVALALVQGSVMSSTWSSPPMAMC